MKPAGMHSHRIIISGGGTGGHIFPAIAIADAIKKMNDNTEILFVGANGRMEMDKVPKAGYSIVGLNIAGIQRRLTLKNLLVPFKLLGSLIKARSIIKNFNPGIAVGVGGYASGPTLRMASMLGVPIVIQEQNSFPGMTNRILSKRASKIFCGFTGMEKFFPKEKIVQTGNPVRQQVLKSEGLRGEAIEYFELDQDKKTILIVGGSLGAKTLNDSLISYLDILEQGEVQFLWQTGKLYYESCKDIVNKSGRGNIVIREFIQRMDLAYAAADLIISRAGAMAISEISLIGKPSILVPSPNVAEDHQTKNAMHLVQENAAVMIVDSEAREQLIVRAIKLVNDPDQLKQMASNARKLGKNNAAEQIADEIFKLLSS